ncbi:hypothetical protein TRVL_02676 [Trypanosoma vivax]|uniref:Uncharacterized protein n=1 Tax=Trypanosoma vivax (strain Y486) TaxID=1055687 RepID=G0U6T3_TRYVY|nr:hypothetical protein TRVL_02676 [Trypanosoma vivax]CCC51588.1 hypothetical protein, conserved in T. vivax [Trypanosoma vivax Y486]
MHNSVLLCSANITVAARCFSPLNIVNGATIVMATDRIPQSLIANLCGISAAVPWAGTSSKPSSSGASLYPRLVISVGSAQLHPHHFSCFLHSRMILPLLSG